MFDLNLEKALMAYGGILYSANVMREKGLTDDPSYAALAIQLESIKSILSQYKAGDILVAFQKEINSIL